MRGLLPLAMFPAALSAQRATEETAAAARPFTIGENESAFTDSETGKYPHKTAMREELVAVKNFHLAETAAGVDYVKGRGPYGLRRQGVDAAKAAGIEPDGMKAAGG